jgi:hypothetical protein
MSTSREIEHASHAASLDAAGKLLLAEALRRGESARDEMEDALVDYGRWLLVNVFRDDAGAALDERVGNPVWSARLDRAGGPTLRLSPRMLSVAVRIVAFDKLIQEQGWHSLDAGRKELLLPLRDLKAIRAAAKHVGAMKLSIRATHIYVSGLLEEQGRARQVRISPSGYAARVRAAHARLAAPGVLKKLSRAPMTAEQRAALSAELEDLKAWAETALAALRP